MVETFDELVMEHDSGSLNTGLSKKMRALMDELATHARDVGKTAKGEISVKFKFEVETNGRVDIKAESNLKGPGLPKTHEIRWIDKAGHLAAEDPRQTRLPLKTVKRETT